MDSYWLTTWVYPSGSVTGKLPTTQVTRPPPPSDRRPDGGGGGEEWGTHLVATQSSLHRHGAAGGGRLVGRNKSQRDAVTA
ncbi:MAG: hypothetical protein ACK5PB_16785 [Pirellula sp.]